MDNIIICIEKGGDKNLAESLSRKINSEISDTEGEQLTVLFDSKGVSLKGFGLSYKGDFEGMLRRASNGRLQHEMLVRAVKTSHTGLTAVDATAGMGEDAFLIAAYGYKVTLHEQNPVIATLLKDSIRRGKKNPLLKDILNRMTVVEGDSINLLNNRIDNVDLIYLDPMFPGRQKTGLINKKLQLIQKMEAPCTSECELFDAAISANPNKIVVKRPLKSPNLANRKPNYVLNGKAIRYDCYVQ